MTNRFSRLTLGSFMMTACAAGQTAAQRSGGAMPPRDSSPLQTDSLVYHLRRSPGEYSAYVTAVFRNKGTGPVYFARCHGSSTGPMFGLRRTGADSTRRLVTDWAWGCVGGVPTGTIQPGDSIAVRVRVGSVDQPPMQPPQQPGDLIGDLRIDLQLCARPSSNSDFCSAPAQSQRSSNAFNVRY